MKSVFYNPLINVTQSCTFVLKQERQFSYLTQHRTVLIVVGLHCVSFQHITTLY